MNESKGRRRLQASGGVTAIKTLGIEALGIKVLDT